MQTCDYYALLLFAFLLMKQSPKNKKGKNADPFKIFLSHPQALTALLKGCVDWSRRVTEDKLLQGTSNI